MPDRREVIALGAVSATPELRAILEELRESVGLVTSLACETLVSEEAGVAKTGSASGTSLDCSRTAVNFEDARIDDIRLVVWGKTTVAGHTARLIDVTGGGTTELARVTLPTTTSGYAEGSWTLIDAIGAGSRQLVLQVWGNASATQTIYHASLQMRTRRLIRK